MGWGNSQRRRGAAPRHYKLPPLGLGFLIRQTGMAYGDGSPDTEQDTVPTRVGVYSLDGDPLEETTVDFTPGKQDEPIAVRVDQPSSSLAILERGIHVPERGFFRLKGATDDPRAPIGGDVLLTRADRQRYKVPVYNLTTSHPLPDIKGEGNLALNFDNSVFHSLFPDAELAIVRIPSPDRASPEEVPEHQARMRELVEQSIEIDGKRYDLVLATGARKHGQDVDERG
jgi:hypothetical protein